MSNTQLILMIAVAGACTFATRLFPFALFRRQKGSAQIHKNIWAMFLPVAILGILIVYCLRDFEKGSINYILPQIIAVALTAGIHLWKKNTLLSIAVGTIGYMLLIHFVFV
ncbi:MAG: AzlD domain-containing protein [Anaerotruncus sp.]|nr:MAG: AzlD domain-containing protein [Anaerotruncus sp.]